jgi:hypothetical protein
MATTAPFREVEHPELRRFLGALQTQLWWRRALVLICAAATLGACVAAVLLVLPTGISRAADGQMMALWVAAAVTGVGALVALVRRPSRVRAARMADRQLDLSSRLATAAEVLDGRLSGALAPAQLADTWRTVQNVSPWHAFPRAWSSVRGALGAAAVGAIILALAVTGVLATWTTALVPGLADMANTSTAATEAAADDVQNAVDSANNAAPVDASTNTAAPARTLEQLQDAAERSRLSESALQRLADSLRATAAARDVGESLRRGDYDLAATQMVELGRESDQLSRAAKRELALALQKTAQQSVELDPQLAIAEERTARALTRQSYVETRRAMEDLARAIGDAKNGVVSQEQLAKGLQQLQEQSQPGAAAPDGEEGFIEDIPGTAPNQTGILQGANSSIQLPGPEGDPRDSNRPGAGANAGGDPLGALTSRLNVPPVEVALETMLADDRGRPVSDPAAPIVKVSETNQAGIKPSDVVQPGDPIREVAEQTVEPAAHRQAVREFFQQTRDPGTR